MADNDLNEVFEEEMDDATVITVPIDATLSNSNEAADAKAVGDALALKADKSELAQAVNVNGQTADAQGNILVSGTDIPMSGTDSTTIRDAISAEAGKTGATIPISTEQGAPTIAEAIEGISGQTAATIPMTADSTTTIGAKIATMDTIDAAHTSAITALQNKTGADILLGGSSVETVKEAIEQRALTVNGNGADSRGDVQLHTVPFAQNLESELNQTVTETFEMRTSGGAASVENSDAWLLAVKGNRVHNGYSPEELTMAASGCTATMDEDAFREAVSGSITLTLTYEDGNWSTDPTTYGVTVTGTPSEGATIGIVYVAEEAGTIIVADPGALVATGWNLYNNDTGYAEVLKYSETYGFGVAGTYTKLEYAATLTGARTTITVTDGKFTVPGDGFVFVTGGNGTDTAIWMTWSDWGSGYAGDFEAYSENSVSIASVMSSLFPHGLMQVGDVRDEINISTGKAYQRIERVDNTGANMAAAKASGRAYEYDENYIYIVRAEETETAITIDGEFAANDHGMEWFTGTDVGVWSQVLYGNNLKNKLERDTLTISEQELEPEQQAQVLQNIGAAAALAGKLGFVQVASVPGNSNRTYVLETDTKAIFVAYGATAATKGFWIVNVTGTSVTIKDIGEASGLAMTVPSNGKVNIANSANIGARIYAIVFAGSVTDAT